MSKTEKFKIIDVEKIPFIKEINSEVDKAFFVDLLETYIEELPESFAGLKTGMENNNSKEVQFFAHKLKGGVITLGVEPLAKVCLNLEIAAKENHLDDSAKNGFKKLEDNFDTLLKELVLLKKEYVERKK